MNIVLYGQMISESASQLSSFISVPHNLSTFCESIEQQSRLDHMLAEADVLVSMKFEQKWKNLNRLKLIQIPGVGTDLIAMDSVPKQTKICITNGHGASVSEYVIYGLLSFFHNIKEIEDDFRNRNWGMSSRTSGPFHDQLAGKFIGLVGYGEIGQAVAQRLKTMQCMIHVANRSFIDCSDKIDKYWPLEKLHEMVKHIDALVVCIAHSKETDKIINSTILDNLRKNALLVNVARGACVDESSLYNALKKNKIRGAIIDTWWNYPSREFPCPSPGKYNWLELSNTIVTPHTSAWSKQMWESRLKDIAYNTNAIASKLPLKNEIKRE